MRIWEEPLEIPAYRVGKPELNPIFYTGRAYQGAKGPVYPYPLIAKLTDRREFKTYRAVFLENEYLKLCVLPEVGGRIFQALDKTNNYNFFYRQHVIKPVLIGMLGAWISGGVEWNFPHHHRASGFMEVDYTLTENHDGSKTIWVGEIERRHRMKWIVGITLYPGRSYIEARVKLFNRTPLPHSILYWANVAVHTNENYQVIFPPRTEFATFHGKNQFTEWPISHQVYNGVDYTQGVDLSWWKNHPAPTSFFAWNYEDDFFGGYDHGKKAGVVCVANHHIAPGKKVWSWGRGETGKMWEKILTDTDGPYIELMAGAYSDNQPDYSWMQPYEVKEVRQYWYPLREIGGLKNANINAACNLEVKEGNIASIGFNTTAEYRQAEVILKAGDRVIFKQETDISPDAPFWGEVLVPEAVNEGELRLSLFSAQGEELISYTPLRKEGAAMPEPVRPPLPPREITTTEELYLTGLRLEQFYSPVLEPYPYYEEALKRDPENYRVNTALGILYLKRGMYARAESHFRRALKRLTRNYTSPKDGEAFYYLALALRAQGKLKEAVDTFFKATWSQAWHSAGYYQLAELACGQNEFNKALEYLNSSLLTNSMNTKALNLKAAVLRRLGHEEQAKKIARLVLRIDPLDFWGENELMLSADSQEREEVFQKIERLRRKMRGEVQNYLELAVDYGNCGLLGEAIDVLERYVEANVDKKHIFPMVYYYLSYFYLKEGEEEKAVQLVEKAAKMPPDYCFPFRLESVEVLRSAEELLPMDARAPYYLGNLLYDLQPEKALEEWERSRSLDNSFSIVHRNLGLAYSRVENNIQKAIASLERAISCNNKDPRLYYELDRLYEIEGVSPAERLRLLERKHEVVKESDDALMREVELLVLAGQYSRAIEIMKNHHFHIWEGGGRIHSIYVDAHLMRGEERMRAGKYSEALSDFKAALLYPDNLEVGKPYRGGRDSQVYYFIGTAFEALGDSERARKFYEKAIEEVHGWTEVRYYQGLALKKLGKEKEAKTIFVGLIESGRARLEKGERMDFFTKFGKKQLAKIRQAEAHFLIGLGCLGMGRISEAREEFNKTLRLNMNHTGATRQLLSLK
ncbi:MAG: DUF5107 domain-containing protein [Candidatus Aminicenantales bacterium]